MFWNELVPAARKIIELDNELLLDNDMIDHHNDVNDINLINQCHESNEVYNEDSSAEMAFLPSEEAFELCKLSPGGYEVLETLAERGLREGGQTKHGSHVRKACEQVNEIYSRYYASNDVKRDPGRWSYHILRNFADKLDMEEAYRTHMDNLTDYSG